MIAQILASIIFIAMFIFTKAMAKRFNKRVFRFTVRESVRGDDDND